MGILKNSFLLLLGLGLPFFCIGCTTPVRVKNTTRTFRTVVVDAGHGGRDSGAIKRGVMEKTAALDVACRLQSKLQEAGFQTVMTRKGDYFVELTERAAISNRQNNAIFVSIHFNDSRKRRVNGVETYYYSPVSQDLAMRIGRSLGGLAPNRGARFASFRVLRLNAYPAVLVECGFLSNGHDATLARRAAYRDQLATQIARAIVQLRFP